VKELLEALTLFAKYTDARHPTCCEHDTLYVLVDPADVSAEDRARLEALGFIAHEDDKNFYSYRFGAA
jgi:hypothetical protein